MSGPPSARVFSIDSPPPPRKVLGRPVVKISLPPPGSAEAAIIRDKDGKIFMQAETGAVSKRFPPGETVGYFKSEHFEDGILEIGDRVPAPTGDDAW